MVPPTPPGRSRTRRARLTIPVDENAISPAPLVLDRVGTRLRGLSMRTDAARLRLTGGLTLTERVEADSGEPGDWSFLRRPALLGFVAVMSICIGASLPTSPITLEMGGTWLRSSAATCSPTRPRAR